MTRRGGHADRQRRLRFWAAAVLAAALATLALLIDRNPAGLVAAAIASAAALVFTLRLPRPRGQGPDWRDRTHAIGRAVLLAGLVMLLGALAAGHAGEKRARIPALCESQRAQLAGWDLRLVQIVPAAGEGFTAIQADLEASRKGAPALALSPRLLHRFAQGPAGDGSLRQRGLPGDLTLRLAGFDSAGGCIALDAAWRPLAVWAPIGAWLAALGALAMALISWGSLEWRRGARVRIAMRREDRPLPGRPAAARRPPGRLLPALATGLALVLIALLVLPRPADVPVPAYPGGAALIKARQSLIEGPPNTNRWIVIADAMARRGRYGDAAEILLGAVQSTPRDSEGWLALGDALYAHAGGVLTPAAELAYERADRAGLASYAARPLAAEVMERSGRPALARAWRARATGSMQP